MKKLQLDLLDLIHDRAATGEVVFDCMLKVAYELGFEYVSYGFQLPVPMSRPKIVLMSNYPAAWRETYERLEYIKIDPTVSHARRSLMPIVWSDHVFHEARHMWEDAQAHGLKRGWAQSCADGLGGAGMLTFSRSGQDVTVKELEANEYMMRWTVHVAHMAYSRLLRDESLKAVAALTEREIEVLKWTADGKSAQDISDILNISRSTIEFHIKNAVSKLQVPNKTSAVVRAVTMGLLG